MRVIIDGLLRVQDVWLRTDPRMSRSAKQKHCDGTERASKSRLGHRLGWPCVALMYVLRLGALEGRATKAGTDGLLPDDPRGGIDSVAGRLGNWTSEYVSTGVVTSKILKG